MVRKWMFGTDHVYIRQVPHKISRRRSSSSSRTGLPNPPRATTTSPPPPPLSSPSIRTNSGAKRDFKWTAGENGRGRRGEPTSQTHTEAQTRRGGRFPSGEEEEENEKKWPSFNFPNCSVAAIFRATEGRGGGGGEEENGSWTRHLMLSGRERRCPSLPPSLFLFLAAKKTSGRRSRKRGGGGEEERAMKMTIMMAETEGGGGDATTAILYGQQHEIILGN